VEDESSAEGPARRPPNPPGSTPTVAQPAPLREAVTWPSPDLGPDEVPPPPPRLPPVPRPVVQGVDPRVVAVIAVVAALLGAATTALIFVLAR
jgi:hypothetical protein